MHKNSLAVLARDTGLLSTAVRLPAAGMVNTTSARRPGSKYCVTCPAASSSSSLRLELGPVLNVTF